MTDQPTPNTLSGLISQAKTNADNGAIADLQCGTIALFYALYRLGGCAYGDSIEGLSRFVSEQVGLYDQLCNRSTGQP